MMQSFQSRPGPVSLILAALVGGAAAPATAQTTDAQPPQAQLLVQGGRLEQRALDTPAFLSVIGAEELRAAGAQVHLSESLVHAPGVVALNRYNFAQDVQISIRGFGARAPFGLRGVRLIADGIPATTPDGQGQASTVSLTSAGRIEVLAGPLAQLYGNASGGVIQTFTREAGEEAQVLAGLTLGSAGLQRQHLQASGRSGALGLVADYSALDLQGWREHSAAIRRQFNSVLTADLPTGSRVRLVANRFEMPLALDPLGLGSTQWRANPRQAGAGAMAQRTRKLVAQDQIGAVVEHRVDDSRRLQWRVYAGSRDNLQYQASGRWVGLSRVFHGTGLQWQQTLAAGVGGRIEAVLGFDLDRSDELRQGGLSTAGEKTGPLTRDENNRAGNTDAFGQIRWHLGDALAGAPWTLTAGWRHSHVVLQSQDRFVADRRDGSGRVDYRHQAPVLGATWHLQDTLNLYANWGRGFETPTLAEAAYSLGSTGIEPLFNPHLRAARSLHREVGLKCAPSAAIRLEAALFRIDVADEIVLARSAQGNSVFANATSTRRQGAELFARYAASRHWQARLGLSRLTARYESAFASGSLQVPAGQALPGLPATQGQAAVLWAEKGFATGAPGMPLGWSGSVEGLARSAMWAADAQSAVSRAPGYGLLHLRLRHRSHLRGADLEAWAAWENLGHRPYVGSVIVNQAGGQYFEPGMPRQWMAGVRLSRAL
ncbi:MAG: TonB-dependent receptor family protein [Limnohabitans sp.]